MAVDNFILETEVREGLGKEDALKLRESQRIPAVVYGPDMKENLYVTIDYKEFEKAFKTCGKHSIVTLNVGKKKIKAIIKDYKIHAITRNFLHVDFFAFSAKKPFMTDVPVNYVGTPVGVKEGGGLYVFTRKLRVIASIDNLPSAIDVDIASLKIGQYLIVRDIEPKNYKIVTNEGTALVEIK